MIDDTDTITVRFNNFDATAQFSADLFDLTNDIRIEPVSPLQARIPRRYFSEFYSLVETFSGQEDHGSTMPIAEVDRSHMTHEEKASLNRQNALKIMEESNELLRRIRQPS